LSDPAFGTIGVGCHLLRFGSKRLRKGAHSEALHPESTAGLCSMRPGVTATRESRRRRRLLSLPCRTGSRDPSVQAVRLMTRTEITQRSAIRASALRWFQAPPEGPGASAARRATVAACVGVRPQIIIDALHSACRRNKSADVAAVLAYIFDR
jgi:hypothetical protein